MTRIIMIISPVILKKKICNFFPGEANRLFSKCECFFCLYFLDKKRFLGTNRDENMAKF